MKTDINKLLSYDLRELISYLTFSAGLSITNFGGVVGSVDNLNLQQFPEEYSRLLLFLKKLDTKKYLELGVGHGGSFFLSSLFQTNLIVCHAVDGLNYQLDNAAGFSNQQTSINEKVKALKDYKQHYESIEFFNMSTSDFFLRENNIKYDLIFIDADHSYEGVKKDYDNSVKLLNENGLIILHDILALDCGVKQLWGELDDSKKIQEFTHSGRCGIGIYKP